MHYYIAILTILVNHTTDRNNYTSTTTNNNNHNILPAPCPSPRRRRRPAWSPYNMCII